MKAGIYLLGAFHFTSLSPASGLGIPSHLIGRQGSPTNSDRST